MQAKSTFQKLFFGMIFWVTILTFAKMYVVHQHNLVQKDCVIRTRQLLDYITTGKTEQDFLIWPFEQSTVDSAKVILDVWATAAIFDDYTKVKTDTSLSEHIVVKYFPKKGQEDTLSVPLHQTGITVDWNRNTVAGAWRAKLTIGFVSDAEESVK